MVKRCVSEREGEKKREREREILTGIATKVINGVLILLGAIWDSNQQDKLLLKGTNMGIIHKVNIESVFTKINFYF